MSREQRRQEGIDVIRTAIERWAGERDATVHSNETAAPFADLAERLFDLQPGYCPYDCSGCHDDECPCPNCCADCSAQGD